MTAECNVCGAGGPWRAVGGHQEWCAEIRVYLASEDAQVDVAAFWYPRAAAWRQQNG